MTTPDSVALPDELRVPMDELEADAGYLMGRAAADPHCADAMAESVRVKIRALRAEAERLAAQAARDDAALYQTIGERDNYHKWADKLADGIATHLGIDIGEHTAGAGANNPWANALEAIQAVAQSAPLAQQREYPPLPVKECAAIWPAILDWYGESPGADTYEKSHAVDQAITAAMRAYVDAALAAAQVDQPKRVTADAVRMLTTEIEKEVARATAKFPTWPTDPLHAVAVLGEEFGELTKAVLQRTYEPHKSSLEDVRCEAVQTAAMALRFLASLDVYEYRRGEQHAQAAGRVIPADGEVRG